MREYRDASDRLTIGISDDDRDFDIYSSRLLSKCNAKLVQKLCGIGQQYWDYKIEDKIVVLHSDNYMGVSLHIEDGSRDDLLRSIAKIIENKMNVWMQMHDLSYTNMPDGSFDSATQALSEFDWDSEILKEEKAVVAGAEVCHPGMGFVSDDGRTLHVMPASHSRSHYHYQFSVTKKWLAVIPFTRQSIISVLDLSDEYRPAIIQKYYDSNHEGVLELLRLHGKVWQ